jgi:hypothetical protein
VCLDLDETMAANEYWSVKSFMFRDTDGDSGWLPELAMLDFGRDKFVGGDD